MPRNGAMTRERLLDATEALVLERGFAATRVDEVVGEAGVAKGAFFHHFPTKGDLAHALVRRWADRDIAELESALARVERLSHDPLQQLLLFVALFEEAGAEIMSEHSGCLYASFTYERGVLDRRTSAILEEASRAWRERVLAKLEEVAARYPPRLDVDLEAVADQLLVVFEGAFVVARTLAEPGVMAAQLRQYRNYLELLFSPELAIR